MFLTKISLQRKIKTKWFLAANILLALIIVCGINIDTIITTFGGDFNKQRDVYIVDKTDVSFESLKTGINESSKALNTSTHKSSFKIQESDKSEKELKKLVDEDNALVLIADFNNSNELSVKVISKDYLSTVDIGIKPGKGGYVSGKVWLNKGTQLTIAVGGQATDFNGGTNSTSLSPGTTCAGGGGGATDMRLGNQRIIVAGGGGGSAGCDADGQDCKPTYGGDGGASNSGNLGPSSNGQGTGGTINTGNGLMGSYPCGGGGGGGYYGGSGGNGYVTAAVGGSSFFDTSYGTKISEQAGVRVGSGYAKITYLGL